ncbi:MAG TPA: carboxypeptidase regulatory-like domain-containing protein [Candidatus Bathyarchaeia archaeon]|jgi:hypothetical protein|nr:carboxypeptidase regulatory-like domain-containing protein [Candidatus Bathyarchaeia archaeon]
MKWSSVVCAAVVCAYIFLFFAGQAKTQGTDAAVSGQITDPSGRVVPGVTVVLTNLNTNVPYTTQTNHEGIYRFTAVQRGIYRANVTKDGFASIVKGDIELHVQDQVSINFALKVGSVSETMTIEAGAPMINTTDASVSAVVDQSYIKNMPLNGRSFQDLILLQPGVVTSSPQVGLFGGTNLGFTGEFSVNGQRTEGNYFAVDGVSANLGVTPGFPNSPGLSGSVEGQTALGTTQALVSVDDLQEFRVSSSTYSAEYGRNPGGQIGFETKSGANAWHGSGFDYLRNDYFDANDWFNNYLNVRQAALRQNDFGGTLGGPLTIPGAYSGKDKTFFFVSYEGLRLAQPQAASTGVLVPDLCLRGLGGCAAGVTPAAPALLPVMKAFPLPSPNGVDDGGIQQFFGSWSNPSSLDATSVRFDHVIKDKLRLFFRFSNTASSSAQRFATTPSTDQITSTTTRTYTGGASILFSSRLTNDVRVNYSTNEVPQRFEIVPFGGGSFVDMRQLSGVGAGGTVIFNWCCLNDNANLAQGAFSASQEQWNLVDTLSLSVGRHQFKFGADYRRLTPHVTQLNPSVNYFFCDTSCSGDGSTLDSKFTNNTTDFLSVNAASPAYPLYQNFSAFGQDEWKVTPRLTLSMGLRWEVNPPPGVTQGLMPYTAQGLSDYNTAYAAPQGTPLYHTTWFNFAPRLGAAYVLRSAPGWETVLRAGGGVFYDTGNQNGSAGFFNVGFGSSDILPSGAAFPVNVATDINPNTGQPGLDNPINQPCNNNAPPSPSNPSPCPPYSLTAFYPHLQLPYTWQWNASMEQELGQSQVLAVRFVGSHASRLIQNEAVNVSGNPNVTPPIPANPSLNGLNLVFNNLTADYDSLQAQFTRRLSRGLTSIVSYTWSHCIDYGSYNYSLAAQRGNCAFDVRHNLSAAFSYDLPNVGHSGLVRALVGHWGIDNRFTARTGFPIDLNGNGALLPNGKTYDQGLSFVANQPVYLYGANCASVLTGPIQELQPGQGCPGGKALNPNAFENVQCPPGNPFCYGNVPRNFARLFGAWQMDVAVRREFPIYENLKLQFRAEAFNVFNHPNFGAVDGNCVGSPGTPGCFGLTGSSFGLAQSTLANSLGVLNPLYQMGGPRSMQFALKLIF